MRLLHLIFLNLAKLPMSGYKFRPFFIKMAGVRVVDYKSVFIGEGVRFDTLYPFEIVIEEGASIATNSVILTHYYNPRTEKYSHGEVKIGAHAFLGANTIITKPVSIGESAVVGAGSVVTKDIPAREIWAGNPARCIGKK